MKNTEENEIVDEGDLAAADNTNSETTLDAEGLDDSVVAEEAAGDTIKKLREKLKKALAEKQEYLTGWQKDKAEFVNARKRDIESQKDFIKFANENLMAELIAVLDSFGMAFANKEAWEKVDKNWRTGVEYISNQLKKVLEDNGLKEINPEGQKFDPMRDEAIEHEVVTDEKWNHMVTAVIQKGYSYNGRTLKAPKVKVGEFKK
jgi:molecular chaperone GrpE